VYEVWLEASCKRDLRRLQKNDFERIISAIKSLAENPRPQGVRKISGTGRGWRIRVGAFRVIFEIDDERKSVFIMRVRHRKEVYK
jgi:mRNA interferase RelE/StbE